MSVINKLFKKKDEEVLQQDLNEKIRPGAIFMMQLLFEEALIQPVREVIDLCMNEYATGQR